MILFDNRRISLTSTIREAAGLKKIESVQPISKKIAYLILIYSTIIGACIGPWLISIPAEKYIKVSWRYFM